MTTESKSIGQSYVHFALLCFVEREVQVIVDVFVVITLFVVDGRRNNAILDGEDACNGFYHHRTTHYDFAPTLMNKVLGVTNPPSDYSMGHLITDTCPRNWHIVGDNLNYAFIVENHTILEKHPSGYIEISDSALNPLENYKIDNRKLNEAILSLNRFYK